MKAHAIYDPRTRKLIFESIRLTEEQAQQAAFKPLMSYGWKKSDIPKLNLKTVVVDVTLRRKKK